MQNIIDRLVFQVSSFQEGFQSLSRIKSLKDLAKQFMHILRGNLLVVEVDIFYKAKGEDEWRELYSTKNGSEVFTCHFKEAKTFNIFYPDDSRIKACVTLPLIDGSYFGILLGKKLDKSEYSQFDKVSLQIFLQLLDNAYQSFIARRKEKDLIFSLNYRVLQLNSLIDTGIEISRLEQDHSLLRLALERGAALTNASKGLLRVKKGRSVVQKIFFPAPFKSKRLENSKLMIQASFRFHDHVYSFYLFEKESRRGVISFEATDQMLLEAFARQVNAVLENHYLLQQALEKQKIDQDISVAGAIQQKIIPELLPSITGYEIFGKNIPTKYVGGDYYDCIALPDGRYALVMADVSGKGVAASLLVSTLQASLKAYLDSPFELPQLVQKLNKVIYDAATIDKYITAFFALLDPGSGELESVNAGHNPIYLGRQDGKIVELTSGGIPLGMMGLPFPYTSEKRTLNRGDRLLLYTDGVTEAMNENEEEYDDEVSLVEFIKRNNPANARQFIDDLYEDIFQFTGDTPQSDDITALYLIRKS